MNCYCVEQEICFPPPKKCHVFSIELYPMLHTVTSVYLMLQYSIYKVSIVHIFHMTVYNIKSKCLVYYTK